VRRAVLPFATTATLTLAEPWPDVGLIVTQEASANAVHWQSRGASTLIVRLPPLEENIPDAPFTAGAQRITDGPTTSVSVVVPPQPYTAREARAVTRIRWRWERRWNLLADMMRHLFASGADAFLSPMAGV